MPRIFKGTETLLKLFVPRVDEGNLETLKIGLFTDDTNNAAEFYGDNMSIDGDTVYLKVNAWSFDTMNDGVLNYIAEIEIGEETIITERQSNYFLKTPNQYVPVGPDLSDFYTKEEIDEMLEDIEVDVDLTGYATEQWVEDKTYATEQWVRRQGYVTDSDVNDYVGNEIGQLEEIINTKQDELISGTNIKTINGNNILGEGDITIEGGSGEQEVYIEEWYDRPTLEQYNRIVELLTSGKVVYHKKDKGIFPLIYSEESVLEKETTMMADNVYKYDVTSTNAVGKGIHYRYDSGFQLRGTNYKIKQPSDSGKGFVRVYHDNKGTSCPISYDATNKIATALVGENIYKWDFVNGENDGFNYFPEIIPITGGGGSGDADLSNYYTKEETDELIANSSVMLEAADDGVLTYSQINGIRDNWTNAYVKVHLQENLIPVDKYVAVTSLYINDALGDNKNIHLEGICEGYLYTWDIKGSNTEGILVRTPISEGGADLSNYYTKEEVDELVSNSGESGGESDCIVIQYVGDYTVDYDGEEVEYNYQGSERQAQNIDAIQRILSGEVKAVYYQYLHEQVYRTDEDGRNNKPTWLMMPMVYRYPSHDNIARFMGVINKDEWGGTDELYAVGIMLNESDASIFQYNESQIETGSGDSSTSDGSSSSSGVVVVELPTNMGLTNAMAKTISDNMGNVVINVKGLFGAVNTKYSVIHCRYMSSPSTETPTIVTTMNGTELYKWTITDTIKNYTPTKKTLAFA